MNSVSRKAKLIAWTAMLLLGGVLAASGGVTDDTASLGDIGWMAGSKWVAETTGPDGKPLWVESVMEWTHHKTGIKFQTVFRREDGATPAYEGLFAWHPKKKQVVFFYTSRTGALSEGTLRKVGEILVQDLVNIKPDGSREKLLTHILRRGEDSYDWLVFVPRGNEWEEVMRLTYHRRPLAEESEPATGEESPLAAIGWLAGGKWVTEAPGPDGKLMIRTSFFEWSANRRALRFWSIVKLSDGKVVPYVEGAYYWRPDKKSLWFWYVDPGAYYEGEVKWDGKRLDHIFEGVNDKGKRSQWRYWFEREGKDRMPIKIFSHKDGEWNEMVSLVYERQN